MILHADREIVAAQTGLLDYAVARGPCLDLNSVGQLFQRLVMRTVHRRESMQRERQRPVWLRSGNRIRAGQCERQVCSHGERRKGEHWTQHRPVAGVLDGESGDV